MQVTSGDTFHSGGGPPVLNPAFHPDLHDVFIYRIAVLKNHVLHYETKQPLSWQQIADLATDSYYPLYTHNQRLEADDVMAAYADYFVAHVRRISGLSVASAANMFMSLFTEEARNHEVDFYNMFEGKRIAKFDTAEMCKTLREWHPQQELLAELEVQYHTLLAAKRARREVEEEANPPKPIDKFSHMFAGKPSPFFGADSQLQANARPETPPHPLKAPNVPSVP